MTNPLRTVVGTTLRWGGVWAAIGLVLGVAMMLGRVPPLAEPGAPKEFGFYWFWVPFCLGVTSVFGAALGLIYSCLMLVVDLWLLIGDNRLSASRVYVQRLACGATAGGLISFPILSDLSGLWGVGLGVASALVSSYVHLRKARPAKVQARGKDEKQAG